MSVCVLAGGAGYEFLSLDRLPDGDGALGPVFEAMRHRFGLLPGVVIIPDNVRFRTVRSVSESGFISETSYFWGFFLVAPSQRLSSLWQGIGWRKFDDLIGQVAMPSHAAILRDFMGCEHGYAAARWFARATFAEGA